MALNQIHYGSLKLRRDITELKDLATKHNSAKKSPEDIKTNRETGNDQAPTSPWNSLKEEKYLRNLLLVKITNPNQREVSNQCNHLPSENHNTNQDVHQSAVLTFLGSIQSFD